MVRLCRRLTPAKAEPQGNGPQRSWPWAPACAGAPWLRSGGFTLIEMMVALAVFSLAAMALIRLEGGTIRGATILDSTLTAQMVARNVAIEALTDTGPPAIGKATGQETNGGRTWAWTRVTTPTGDVRILRIDVAVAEPGGTVQSRLTVVRPATQPITVTSS